MRAAFKKNLKELGWHEQRMEGGGYLYRDFEDRMAMISPQIWQLSQNPDSFRLELNPCLTTRRFRGYWALLHKSREGFIL